MHNVSNLLEYSWSQDIDVAVVCEAPDEWAKKCEVKHYRTVQRVDPNAVVGIEVFVKNDDPIPLHYFRENRRHATLRFAPWNINLVVAHLNSNRTQNAKQVRGVDIQKMVNDLDRIEEVYASKQSIILGDLNIGLFEDQMSDILGMNARLYRYQMEKQTASVHEYERDLFYNPMIKVYQHAEEPDKPKGTHYYRGKPEQWFCYDHVLMKRAVLPRFDSRHLRVLTRLGADPLVIGNVMNTKISDHLPVYFEISDNGGTKNE